MLVFSACGQENAVQKELTPVGTYLYELSDDAGSTFSIDRYEEFVYQTEHYYDATMESEGSPDWGIRILFTDYDEESGDGLHDYMYFYRCNSSLGWPDVESADSGELVNAGDYKFMLYFLEDKVVGYSSLGTGWDEGIYFEVSQKTWEESPAAEQPDAEISCDLSVVPYQGEAFTKSVFAAGGEEIYLCGIKSDGTYFLGCMEEEDDVFREFEVSMDEGMRAFNMAVDAQGNCHILWMQRGIIIWKTETPSWRW